jgi:hypothetical protein
MLAEIAHCALTRIPVDTVLFPGDYLRLNCSSDISLVGWWYTKPGSAATAIADRRGSIVAGKETLYKTDSTVPCDLLGLQPANATYCGSYMCVDGFIGTQEVSVGVSYGGTPQCTVNTTTVTPEGLVQFNCTVEICGTVNSQLGIFINGSALLHTTDNFTTIVASGRNVIGSEVKCIVSYGSLGTFTGVCPQVQQYVSPGTTTISDRITGTVSSTTAAPCNVCEASSGYRAKIAAAVIVAVSISIIVVVLIFYIRRKTGHC